MAALLDVILPVFLVIGCGYVTVWRGYLSLSDVDGLMNFTQKFAIPLLLFRAFARLDLTGSFNPALLASFYLGLVIAFVVGLFGARLLFARPWEDSVAIGFICLFSNTFLLGLPITERAYGAEALTGNYSIIALHSIVGFGIGITTMEVVRAGGSASGSGKVALRVVKSMLKNPLILGIIAGFAFNLSGLPLTGPIAEAVDLIVRTALPAALFALGGILVQYKPEGDMRTVAFILAVSLILHPVVVYLMGRTTGLSVADLRSGVITSAMAPGVNVYMFAHMYGVAKRVAATSVLFGTAATVISAWMWLAILP